MMQLYVNAALLYLASTVFCFFTRDGT